MQSSINRHGLPPDPDELIEEGDPPFADAAEQTAREKADESLNALQHEVRLLNARIGVLREDAEAALKAKATSVDASAHVQLGDYPWLKLAAAIGATFIAARLVRRLPLGVLLAGFAGNIQEMRRQ
ncbi:hypothetical protein HFO93_17480 [Rhizobium leguminosarum]|uniref:hypothetical protein n=1 Tax=Rhizobium TaxID=379 RepID=UPI000477E705|nr:MULTISPECIES: hypothetical protein [Rhizobium]MBW8787456.1 hypothetical protein [Rhizobium leguminosarum]MBY5445238.1 hypothetical protein [Rhizobium leguminosarum]NNG74156.1 hypothetical protein [Rhizobium laguerreae]NNH59349.1 hypothetical protein [Rhizobium laguerreae]UWM83575.1 hypothetical protein N2A41_10240 [Rhizobium leguminosarum bv. viciae]